MGYVRQAAAIVFIMLALLSFEAGKRFKCGMYIIIATLFHTSALVIAPFIAIVVTRGNIVYLIPAIIGAIPAVIYLTSTRYDIMMAGYVNAEYSSSGALVRIFMSAIPSGIFLLNRRKFSLSSNMTLDSVICLNLCTIHRLHSISLVNDRGSTRALSYSNTVDGRRPPACGNCTIFL
jgi:hypothetical protein